MKAHELLERLIGTHFQPFSPGRLADDRYTLTLKSGRTVTIGLGGGCDLRVVVENGWHQLDYLPHAVKAQGDFGAVTVCEDHENFWHRGICFPPDSFRIMTSNTKEGERVMIARRTNGPTRKEPPYMSTLTEQDWEALFSDERAALGGVHWGWDEERYHFLRAADEYLAQAVRVCAEGFLPEWFMPAFNALHRRGLIGEAPTSHASYEEYLNSPEWQALRGQVWKRDEGKCVFCKRPGEDVHHVIYPKRLGTEDPATLLTVCRRCHQLIHGALDAAERTEKGTGLPRIGSQVQK